ncbi:hypothetical protein D3871_26050 [Noviherbaspirillum saxi]|uniref:Uncharacterized protein n=2 Tax=Noviherbaspirillum saxi TaxID=2320863 RepID=A0A3A3FFK0_9BURK|nr:hypothetical protein D3871_26050 [Noviherbaspirillum saxi]
MLERGETASLRERPGFWSRINQSAARYLKAALTPIKARYLPAGPSNIGELLVEQRNDYLGEMNRPLDPQLAVDAYQALYAAKTEEDTDQAVRMYAKAMGADWDTMEAGWRAAGRVASVRSFTMNAMSTLWPMVLLGGTFVGPRLNYSAAYLGGQVLHSFALGPWLSGIMQVFLVSRSDLSRRDQSDRCEDLKAPPFPKIVKNFEAAMKRAEAAERVWRKTKDDFPDDMAAQEKAWLDVQETLPALETAVKQYLTRADVNTINYKNQYYQSIGKYLKFLTNLAAGWVGYSAGRQAQLAIQIAANLSQMVAQQITAPWDEVAKQKYTLLATLRTGAFLKEESRKTPPNMLTADDVDTGALRKQLRGPLEVRMRQVQEIYAYQRKKIEQSIAIAMGMNPTSWRKWKALEQKTAAHAAQKEPATKWKETEKEEYDRLEERAKQVITTEDVQRRKDLALLAEMRIPEGQSQGDTLEIEQEIGEDKKLWKKLSESIDEDKLVRDDKLLKLINLEIRKADSITVDDWDKVRQLGKREKISISEQTLLAELDRRMEKPTDAQEAKRRALEAKAKNSLSRHELTMLASLRKQKRLLKQNAATLATLEAKDHENNPWEPGLSRQEIVQMTQLRLTAESDKQKAAQLKYLEARLPESLTLKEWEELKNLREQSRELDSDEMVERKDLSKKRRSGLTDSEAADLQSVRDRMPNSLSLLDWSERDALYNKLPEESRGELEMLIALIKKRQEDASKGVSKSGNPINALSNEQRSEYQNLLDKESLVFSKEDGEHLLALEQQDQTSLSDADENEREALENRRPLNSAEENKLSDYRSRIQTGLTIAERNELIALRMEATRAGGNPDKTVIENLEADLRGIIKDQEARKNGNWADISENNKQILHRALNISPDQGHLWSPSRWTSEITSEWRTAWHTGMTKAGQELSQQVSQQYGTGFQMGVANNNALLLGGAVNGLIGDYLRAYKDPGYSTPIATRIGMTSMSLTVAGYTSYCAYQLLSVGGREFGLTDWLSVIFGAQGPAASGALINNKINSRDNDKQLMASGERPYVGTEAWVYGGKLKQALAEAGSAILVLHRDSGAARRATSLYKRAKRLQDANKADEKEFKKKVAERNRIQYSPSVTREADKQDEKKPNKDTRRRTELPEYLFPENDYDATDILTASYAGGIRCLIEGAGLIEDVFTNLDESYRESGFFENFSRLVKIFRTERGAVDIRYEREYLDDLIGAWDSMEAVARESEECPAQVKEICDQVRKQTEKISAIAVARIEALKKKQETRVLGVAANAMRNPALHSTMSGNGVRTDIEKLSRNDAGDTDNIEKNVAAIYAHLDAIRQLDNLLAGRDEQTPDQSRQSFDERLQQERKVPERLNRFSKQQLVVAARNFNDMLNRTHEQGHLNLVLAAERIQNELNATLDRIVTSMPAEEKAVFPYHEKQSEDRNCLLHAFNHAIHAITGKEHAITSEVWDKHTEQTNTGQDGLADLQAVLAYKAEGIPDFAETVIYPYNVDMLAQALNGERRCAIVYLGPTGTTKLEEGEAHPVGHYVTLVWHKNPERDTWEAYKVDSNEAKQELIPDVAQYLKDKMQNGGMNRVQLLVPKHDGEPLFRWKMAMEQSNRIENAALLLTRAFPEQRETVVVNLQNYLDTKTIAATEIDAKHLRDFVIGNVNSKVKNELLVFKRDEDSQPTGATKAPFEKLHASLEKNGLTRAIAVVDTAPFFYLIEKDKNDEGGTYTITCPNHCMTSNPNAIRPRAYADLLGSECADDDDLKGLQQADRIDIFCVSADETEINQDLLARLAPSDQVPSNKGIDRVDIEKEDSRESARMQLLRYMEEKKISAMTLDTFTALNDWKTINKQNGQGTERTTAALFDELRTSLEGPPRIATAILEIDAAPFFYLLAENEKGEYTITDPSQDKTWQYSALSDDACHELNGVKDTNQLKFRPFDRDLFFVVNRSAMADYIETGYEEEEIGAGPDPDRVKLTLDYGNQRDVLCDKLVPLLDRICRDDKEKCKDQWQWLSELTADNVISRSSSEDEEAINLTKLNAFLAKIANDQVANEIQVVKKQMAEIDDNVVAPPYDKLVNSLAAQKVTKALLSIDAAPFFYLCERDEGGTYRFTESKHDPDYREVTGADQAAGDSTASSIDSSSAPKAKKEKSSAEFPPQTVLAAQNEIRVLVIQRSVEPELLNHEEKNIASDEAVVRKKRNPIHKIQKTFKKWGGRIQDMIRDRS